MVEVKLKLDHSGNEVHATKVDGPLVELKIIKNEEGVIATHVMTLTPEEAEILGVALVDLV